jgi:hypothetical protein
MLLYCWKAFNELDLIEFILESSNIRCGRYSFCVGFVARNSKQLQKSGLEGKIVQPSMCSHY